MKPLRNSSSDCAMSEPSHFRLQFIVFALVSTSFENIYITQPVLPVLQQEFSSDTVTVSAVILGIALANLPFGFLADRVSIRPLILAGEVMVAACSIACALTHHLWTLISLRFVQGIFIPALTTCLAAYLAITLPMERLSIVMGAYVSATVLGGLARPSSGRLDTPAAVLALRFSVRRPAHCSCNNRSHARISVIFCASGPADANNQLSEVAEAERLAAFLFLCCRQFCYFFLGVQLSPVPPFSAPVQLFNRADNNAVFVLCGGHFHGTGRRTLQHPAWQWDHTGRRLFAVLGLSLAVLMLPAPAAVVAGLLGIRAGFFAVHAAAVGALRRRLSCGHGRANALYVLFYYLGGWSGITLSSFAHRPCGWNTVIVLCLAILLIPLAAGLSRRDLPITTTGRQSDSRRFSLLPEPD